MWEVSAPHHVGLSIGLLMKRLSTEKGEREKKNQTERVRKTIERETDNQTERERETQTDRQTETQSPRRQLQCLRIAKVAALPFYYISLVTQTSFAAMWEKLQRQVSTRKGVIGGHLGSCLPCTSNHCGSRSIPHIFPPQLRTSPHVMARKLK